MPRISNTGRCGVPLILNNNNYQKPVCLIFVMGDNQVRQSLVSFAMSGYLLL